jgi:hypothetical protein
MVWAYRCSVYNLGSLEMHTRDFVIDFDKLYVYIAP